ncbi:hypothetical protein [Nocardioides sp. 616]|uniref:hypothetical protein n=1 Tax=Nocardioides sp. 616 TaxID=2268090 RepID=UPI000CE4258D|nr:hypothetical protein [Nocardioides sp. 616]
MTLAHTLLRRAIAVLAVPMVGAGLLAAPVAAAPTEPVVVVPLLETLPLGAPVAGPHLEGRRTLVDGNVRISVPAHVWVVGRAAGRGYVVEAWRGRLADVLRVERDGTRRVLARGVDGSQLSADGRLLVTSKVVRFRTELRVLRARTGKVLASRTLNDAVYALDVDRDRVLVGGVGGASGGTHLWQHRTGRVARLSNQSAYVGDLDLGIYARFTDDADQYNGGCTVLARIDSGRQLWRNCGESVSGFSPDGRSVLVVGNGGVSARVRTLAGKPVIRYRVASPQTFEDVEWDADGRVLVSLYGEDQVTHLAACSGAECTRVPEVTTSSAGTS